MKFDKCITCIGIIHTGVCYMESVCEGQLFRETAQKLNTLEDIKRYIREQLSVNGHISESVLCEYNLEVSRL